MSAIALMAGPLPAEQGKRGTMEAVLEEPPGMDEQAFRALYTRTARPLRAYLARVTGNSVLADDLLQETYYRLLRSRFATADRAHLRHYLFRIASNLARDHFRRPRREVAEVAEAASPENFDDEVHLRSDVGGALVGLRPRDRAMLWLAYVEGSTHEEIATALGLRPASIRSMLSRARGRLAVLLRARGLGPDTDGSAL
jgi:RNA polymerase sigma-70 factor (ECF subfamily)